ncbi:MAG TPA: hypothetical protein VIL20_23595 [Sandaracinaceae bacterium]
MNDAWQWALVVVIEAAALLFLVSRLFGWRRRPRALTKPDVKTSALVRKKKGSGGHCA